MSGCSARKSEPIGRHEVLGGLDLQVVLEDHETLGVERAVGGAGLAELRLTVEHGLVGLVAGVAERQHLGDVDAVLVREAAFAVEASLAVGGRRQGDGLALEVGERRDTFGLAVLLRHEEGVGVGRRRDVEQRDARGLEQVGAVGGELFAVTGLEGLGVAAVLLGVEEVDDAADVFRHDVDAVGEGRHVGVAGVDQLGLDGVARRSRGAVGTSRRRAWPRGSSGRRSVSDPLSAAADDSAGSDASSSEARSSPAQPAARKRAPAVRTAARERRTSMGFLLCPAAVATRVRMLLSADGVGCFVNRRGSHRHSHLTIR